MLIECYDKSGAEVYEIIIKQIFQDLVLGASVDDLKAFVNPDEPVFILAIKMRKTSNAVNFGDVAIFTYDKENDITKIFVENENYLPNILKVLWYIMKVTVKFIGPTRKLNHWKSIAKIELAPHKSST